jgi:4-hydroxymandelate synthase
MIIEAIDHIEFYVENADQTASHLCDAFGFRIQGRGGPETGLDGCRSILLSQGDITILVTSALHGDHPAADYVWRHGDGVAVIAVTTSDAHTAFAEAVEHGAVPVASPVVRGHCAARVTFATVNAFGDVAYRFVAREATGAPFAPGVIAQTSPTPASGGPLTAVDHIAVCVPAGELAGTVRRHQEVFGFAETFQERIVVGSQAMDSKVMQSPSGKVTLTIIEPDDTREPGQIDEFVRSHGGAGVQHVAFRTDDITAAIPAIAGRGVRFLSTPPSYYDTLTARLGSLGVPVGTLRELNILADQDNWGAMLQIFTESRHPRRTLFYELIERRGARTFGSNNIKALYEAVERQRAADQALRS